MGHSLFIKNMSALWRKDPHLAQRIDEIHDEQRMEVVQTRSGQATAWMNTDHRLRTGATGGTGGQAASGTRIFLHSRYDPVVEARRLIDGLNLEGKSAGVEDSACPTKFCFVVCGLGLGYHVRELYARLTPTGQEVPEACIIVSEPSLPLLSTALSCVDLSDIIDSGRLVILNELDKATVHERLKPHNTLMMLGAQFVMHPPSQQVAGEFHANARRQVTDYIAYSRMTLLTLVGNAQTTCRNIAHNLPTYLTTVPINILRNRFKGCPGVIISGGPSLRRNIHLLSEMKGKAVLIATQTLFKPLLAGGIVPDYVTSLDFHAISQQFFPGASVENRCRGCPIPSRGGGRMGRTKPRADKTSPPPSERVGHPPLDKVHLVAEPKVSWHVLDNYDGPISVLHSAFAEELIGPELAARGGLKPGATVAHLAFYLAEYMGCDPIVFVGQDLAFTGHCFYVPGVEVHNTWRGEINRFNTMETKEWERIARNRAILRKTTDVHGSEVYTDELLFTYLEQFERDFVATRARIIDATEGGARMRGAEVMTLRETIDRHCTLPLPADSFKYLRTCNWNDTSRLEAARGQLEARIDEVEQLSQVCRRMLVLLDELQGLTHDPQAFNQRLIRVDELRTVVTRSQRAYRIVNAASQLAELQRFTADRKLGAADTVGVERAKRQLARDVQYVQSVQDGAQLVIDMLDKTLARIDAHPVRAGGSLRGGGLQRSEKP